MAMFMSTFKHMRIVQKLLTCQGLWPQIILMLLCNIAVLSYGLQAAWTTTIQPALQSNNSPLSIPPLTDDQISWMGSLPSIPRGLFAPLFGWLMDRFGRRSALILATVPNLITYLILCFSSDINMVYASRLIGGFCSSGAFVVSSVFIVECCQPYLKDTLSSFSGFFIRLGMILSITLGSCVSYNTLNIVSGSFTVLFVLVMFWIPESPAYLVNKGRQTEAVEALTKLWGEKKMDQIKSEINVIEEHLSHTKINQWKLLKLFVTERRLRMAFLISFFVYSYPMFSGYPVIVRYSVDILSDAGSEFSPYLAANLLAVSQLVSSFFGVLLLKTMGHKRLIIWCLTGMSVCLSILALYLLLKTVYPDNIFLSKINIISVVSLVLFVAFNGAGYSTVAISLPPLLFTSETRATASMLLNVWFAIFEFVGSQTFYSIKNVVDLSGALTIFALIGFAGVVALQYIMFEVKNLDFNEIQQKLSGKEPVSGLES